MNGERYVCAHCRVVVEYQLHTYLPGYKRGVCDRCCAFLAREEIGRLNWIVERARDLKRQTEERFDHVLGHALRIKRRAIEVAEEVERSYEPADCGYNEGGVDAAGRIAMLIEKKVEPYA